MEYGLFLDPSISWNLIFASIGCAILFAFFIALIPGIPHFIKKYNEKIRRRKALFPNRAGRHEISLNRDGKNAFNWLWGILAFCSFISIWSLLGPGLYKGGVSNGCYEQRYATEGAYRVVDAKVTFYYQKEPIYAVSEDPRLKDKKYRLVFTRLQALTNETTGLYADLYSYTPKNPLFYDIKLAGKTDPSQPSDFGIIRCFRIPYEQVTENVTFTPEVSTVESTSTPPPTPVELPKFAEKHGDKWWKFTDNPHLK